MGIGDDKELNPYELRMNYFALLVAIFRQCTADEAFMRLNHGGTIWKKHIPKTPIPLEERRQAQEMINLRIKGMKYKDIAKKYGMSIGKIQHWIKREKRIEGELWW